MTIVHDQLDIINVYAVGLAACSHGNTADPLFFVMFYEPREQQLA
jgi:hypothetical protein